jgi:hypothetical protein
MRVDDAHDAIAVPADQKREERKNVYCALCGEETAFRGVGREHAVERAAKFLFRNGH